MIGKQRQSTNRCLVLCNNSPHILPPSPSPFQAAVTWFQIALIVSDVIVNMVFTMELIVRFAVSYGKCKFLW